MLRDRIRQIVRVAGAGVAVSMLIVSPSWAVSISPGGSVNTTVLGTAEIYAIFGHVQGGGSPALEIDFTAGAGNIFTFSASGLIGCCSSIGASFTPDGSPGAMSITGGTSGLSSLSGNTVVPLVGAFVDTDPLNNAPPAALSFDANNLNALSPLLNQVFYIGDGRNGLNNPAGSIINFTAPSNATKLFLGVIDASGFGGSTGFYTDNPGSFDATVNLATSSSVPEPASITLLGLGLAALVGLRWRRP
jgi:hypothetical protein